MKTHNSFSMKILPNINMRSIPMIIDKQLLENRVIVIK